MFRGQTVAIVALSKGIQLLLNSIQVHIVEAEDIQIAVHIQQSHLFQQCEVIPEGVVDCLDNIIMVDCCLMSTSQLI